MTYILHVLHIHMYTYVCAHTYILHTYMTYTYIHMYIHTYMHTYIHMYITYITYTTYAQWNIKIPSVSDFFCFVLFLFVARIWMSRCHSKHTATQCMHCNCHVLFDSEGQVVITTTFVFVFGCVFVVYVLFSCVFPFCVCFRSCCVSFYLFSG